VNLVTDFWQQQSHFGLSSMFSQYDWGVVVGALGLLFYSLFFPITSQIIITGTAAYIVITVLLKGICTLL
jgi:uncharacterized membrane protein YjjP (DUF1212 family)